MNLIKKKKLAAESLKVGKNRIVFNMENLAEIKEAITRQDIRGLKEEGVITIKPIKGRKKIKRRKTRRGPGKIKKTVNKRKQVYVKITRKLRYYIKCLKERGVVDRELYLKIRKKIRMRDFRSKASLKEYLKSIDNVDFDKVSKEKKPETRKIKKKIEKNAKKVEGKKNKVKKAESKSNEEKK